MPVLGFGIRLIAGMASHNGYRRAEAAQRTTTAARNDGDQGMPRFGIEPQLMDGSDDGGGDGSEEDKENDNDTAAGVSGNGNGSGLKRKRPGGKGRRKIAIGQFNCPRQAYVLCVTWVRIQLRCICWAAEYIADKNKRAITFSKRKAGIFSKVGEVRFLALFLRPG